MKLIISAALIVTVLASCNGSKEGNEKSKDNTASKSENMIVKDAHSYANVADVHTTHLHLILNVDFDNQKVSGIVEHKIENTAGVDKVIFDIKDLQIDKVTIGENDEEAKFEIGEADELLGSPLTVSITPETKIVKIHYATTDKTEALQFLNPQQTAGKKYPYLFSQGEAILTRTWIPCQDTPGNRITYSADVKVPSELLAVMSADNPQEKNNTGEYQFKMKNPIPSYLIALAVGDLVFHPIGPRTGVYAEPSMIQSAAFELSDMERMVESAENLYGPYQWGRYDVIVLPPSFPFGGMENPKLTFATPTILAGDKSLVSLIAHELAHSWSGNLVTNATWEDFWLNEGFTVYFENRIMEQIYGKEYADMLALIEYQELQQEVKDISEGEHPEDTHLKLNLAGRNPDDGMTSIAYVKGAFFLKSLENAAGREKFDAFLKKYFTEHQFQTITTEDFVAYLKENLLEKDNVAFNIDEWIYGPGIPESGISITSDKFTKVDAKIEELKNGSAKDLKLKRNDWSTQEWLHFMRHLPSDLSVAKMKELDDIYNFKACGNSELMSEWYVQSIRHGYHGAEKDMEAFLINVGRRKFLMPIYGELANSEEGKQLARKIYEKARPNYHAISTNSIDQLLSYES
ncbi:MAG: M1 family metallopeptidase [Crocinitomicaceae bacterium]|nr:M1 family metallopeptidase [Crocinitomicaceae bacterium]